MKLLNAALSVALVGLIAAPAASAQAYGKGDTTKAKPASHLAQAKNHTEVAIKEGKAGRADAVVTHAQEAMTHAKAADQEKSTVHTQAAIKSLQEAIDHGKMGHADIATKAAQTALEHLNMQSGDREKGGMRKAPTR
ncbi:MAG: hypothetical protein HY700_20965 [Gemmatimonadetes bacterium]|nr:hypothetical protein [Gemmatimonadota bacterium]